MFQMDRTKSFIDSTRWAPTSSKWSETLIKSYYKWVSPGLFHPTSMGKRSYMFFHPVGAHRVWKEKIHMVTLVFTLENGQIRGSKCNRANIPNDKNLYFLGEGNVGDQKKLNGSTWQRFAQTLARNHPKAKSYHDTWLYLPCDFEDPALPPLAPHLGKKYPWVDAIPTHVVPMLFGATRATTPW